MLNGPNSKAADADPESYAKRKQRSPERELKKVEKHKHLGEFRMRNTSLRKASYVSESLHEISARPDSS